MPNVSTPIDLGYLSDQTFGDVSLQHDILRLFVAQARAIAEGLSLRGDGFAGDEGLPMALHRLKGSALAIGAATVAEAAGDAEVMLGGNPAPCAKRVAMACARLQAAITEACTFATTLRDPK